METFISLYLSLSLLLIIVTTISKYKELEDIKDLNVNIKRDLNRELITFILGDINIYIRTLL